MKFQKKTLVTFSVLSLSLATACAGGDGDGEDTPAEGGTEEPTEMDPGTTTGTMDEDPGATTGTSGTTTGTTDSATTIGFDADLGDLVIDFEENFSMMAAGGAGSSLSTLSYNDTAGDPDGGSAEVVVPFDYVGNGGYEDLEKVHVATPLQSPVNMSSAILSVRVQLVSGGSADPACPIVAKAFVKSGETFDWANGSEQNLVEGEWVTLDIDPSLPSWNADDFTADDIRMIGVEISPNTFAGCETGETTVLVDTFSY